MTTTICFRSVKGGQGVTVLTAATALAASREGLNVLIDTYDEDIPAVFALPANPPAWAETPLAETVTYGPNPNGFPTLDDKAPPVGPDVIVTSDPDADADYTVLVTRGCYIALRRFVNTTIHADACVLVAEEGRSLQERDVEDVTGLPVIATEPISQTVARTIDAGTLHMRNLPTSLARTAAAVLHGAHIVKVLDSPRVEG